MEDSWVVRIEGEPDEKEATRDCEGLSDEEAL